MTTDSSRAHRSVRDLVLEDEEAHAAYHDLRQRNALVDSLVRLRRHLRLTQKQLAALMGVKQPAVSGFETEGSDPRLSTLQRYARAVDAVLILDVRPRFSSVSDGPYRATEIDMQTAVNREEPSARARSWHSSAAYVESVG